MILSYYIRDICLKFLTNGSSTTSNSKMGSKAVREAMCKPPYLSSFVQLDRWIVSISPPGTRHLEFDWHDIFFNLYSTTNNYKLIQHQYKIFMKIATSKYLRHKMKIENNKNCDVCVNTCETLEHIYLECPKTLAFLVQVEELIRARIDESYNDQQKVYHFTCNHPIKAVNFINLVANWFIGRQFQNHKPIFLDAFEKFIKYFLVGEKQSIRSCLSV